MQNDNNQENFSIVISAPSGAGKTTIIRKLMQIEDCYIFSISTTTRGRRNDDIDGKSYYFVSEAAFKEKIKNKEFMEWAIVHNNYYGTTKKEVDRIRNIGKTPIFDVDVQGAKQLRDKLNSAVFIFIIPPSINALSDRLKKRASDSEKQISLRLLNAIEELREFKNYDYLVVNEDIDKAVRDIIAIIKAERCKINRNISKVKSILEEKNDNTTKEINRI